MSGTLLPEQDLQKYLSAGRIVAKVREFVRKSVEEGASLLEICDKVESRIVQEGGSPAFPCNIGINEVSAHYTSSVGDLTTIPEGSVVKIDVGVHLDGFIADTAVTISFNEDHNALVKATEEALEKACEAIKPGVRASEIGGLIQKTLKERGFKPIWNLHGHKISQYLLHAGKSIPNVPYFDKTKLKVGEVYAIEPFATTKDAHGRVTELPQVLIYRYRYAGREPRGEAASLLEKVKSKFRTLPFAKRWVYDLMPSVDVEKALSELASAGVLATYPVLIESSKRIVAQAEHTIIITEDGADVITA
jgi:methionyl aminopeptidase